ncbi:hypothetical protein A5792_02215 [Mycolicibacterium peregrinum]|uniref:PASTA domain-containing protein n=1 Tax=Mycolicibacterium peregrinum TaxID=43304 RepID=A0A1A0REJ7_MYCPR|nr:hypothetical protein [Mycolicibacterium peregrinum]OBB32528.1 hypothetical protein A5792_02215 [Mycolicibacterium peregrinum]
MNKLVGTTVTVMGVSLTSMGILTAGAATADDYAGKTYADTQSALASAGMKGVIARSGDTEPDDKCVVTSSEKAPWIKGDKFAAVTDTVLLNLNCSASVANATHPGNSAASPEGRTAIAAAKQQAAQSQAQATTDQATKKH